MRTAITWDMASKAISSFIGSTLKDYAKLSDRLHAAAIMGFVHAADHGDASHLNAFFDGLRENDQNMFKAWLLKFSSYTDVVAGGEVTKQWVGYRSKEGKKGEPVGLFVRPKTEAVRKGQFNPQDMYEGEAFFDTADKNAKPITLAAILAMIAKLDDQIGKREEKATEQAGESITIPEDLRAMVKSLSARGKLALASVEASATLNIQPAPAAVQ